MRVRFYGRLADAIGREAVIDAPDGSSVGEVRRRLVASHSAAANTLARSRAFVAATIVDDERRMAPEEELEFLPPVSGG